MIAVKRLALAAMVVAVTFSGSVALSARQEPDAPAYHIGPKDLIEIRVFEEPKLDVDRRVGDSGTVDLPLLGNFPVQGLTEGEAAARLKEALEREYLQRASVTVRIREYRSKPISVIGAVNNPGNLELSGRWTLLEALTAAGGLAANHGNRVYVLRRAENGESDQLVIDLDELLERGDPRYNIPIFANDLINVPAAVEVSIFCLGQVRSPGALVFRSTDRVTLLAALAKAGGLTDRAANKIRVVRRDDDGETEEIVVGFKALLSGKQPDIELRDGDLVVVKESFF